MFDDGRSSVLSEAYAYMQPRGLTGTAYVFKNSIDTAGYLTTANLLTINSGGWIVANHSESHPHLTALTQAQVETELDNCRIWLNGLGLSLGSRHVAYPFGDYNATVETAMTAQGMLTGRTTASGLIYPRTSNYFPASYELACYDIAKTVSLATAKTYLDLAKSGGGVAALYFHELVASPSLATDWAISDFQALIDYGQSIGIQFLNIADIYNRIIA